MIERENANSILKTNDFLNKTKSFLSSLTKFQKISISLFFIVVTMNMTIVQGSIVSWLLMIATIFSILLTIKGLRSNYIFAIIEVFFYGLIAYQHSIYSDTLLNWMFYIPTSIIGFILWKKNTVKGVEDDSGKTELLKVRSLTKKRLLIVILSMIPVVIVWSIFMNAIGAEAVLISSVIFVVSIFSQFLLILRFREQWYGWAIVNALSVIMWVMTLVQHGSNDWGVLFFWLFLSIMNFNGILEWRKMEKRDLCTPTSLKINHFLTLADSTN